MKVYISIFWFNGLCLLVVFALVIYAKLVDLSVGIVFLPPPAPKYFSAGLLTHTFQILCGVPPLLCTFSFALLDKLQPRSQRNKFILVSAFFTGGYFLNEIYRIHIIFIGIGIPKLVTILVYTLISLLYGLIFRQQIKSTPYTVLLLGLGLLFTAISVDSLHLNGDGTPNLLEGIPKLLSGLNVAIYFWFVCYQQIIDSLSSTNQ